MPAVLLIVSASRSGSTILCNLLGQTTGAFGLGELHNLWDARALDNRMCSCGELVLNCPVWRPILEACYGSAEPSYLRPIFAEIQRHRDACTRVRHMLPLLHHLSPALRAHRRAYVSALESIYATIGTVTGCSVVVDASKLPAYASVLLDSDRLDVRIIFLIRDARATAFSWRRRKSTTVRGRVFTTAQYGLTSSAKEWLVTNWAAGRLARALPPERWLQIRYEDLMRRPDPILRRIAQFAGLPEDGLPLVSPDQAYLTTAHLIAGNQNRFQTGLISLRPDEEWRLAMRAMDRRWVTWLTWPLLRRYGYL
ncbi:MAG: sulfotransferase [Anaerolineales bacterium]|nr:sulfotransferase [Anaerolineales bacterium]